MRNSKKELEAAILQAVYDLDRFACKRSERPDFVLRESGADTTFGVEVTEHFQTESEARVVRVEGYVSNLLDGRPHLHKHDVEILRQVRISIERKEGERVYENLPALLTEVTPYSEYIDSLKAAVYTKEEAVGAYDLSNLNHVNLIVLDHGSRLEIGDGSNLYRHLGNGEFKDRVIDSDFREIFLVTEVEDQRVVYFPVKQLFTTSDIYLFFRALEKFKHPAAPKEVDDGLRLFGAWYESRGRSVGFRQSDSSAVEILYGNCGFTHGEDSFHIRDYQDRPLPMTGSPALNHLENEFLGEFEPELESFMSSHVFQFGAAYDVLQMPPGRGWTGG